MQPDNAYDVLTVLGAVMTFCSVARPILLKSAEKVVDLADHTTVKWDDKPAHKLAAFLDGTAAVFERTGKILGVFAIRRPG